MTDDLISIFDNPTIMAIWQIHIAVFALAALLGIWTGLSRRPWYIGTTAFCSLLLLCIPIRAPEPAFTLLIGVPLVALGCRLLRPWLAPEDLTTGRSNRRPAWRWHFGLIDLLWLTIVVGILALLLTRLGAMPYQIDWIDLAISTGCILALSLATVVGHYQSSWKRKLVMTFVQLVLANAAVTIHLTFANDWWFIADFWNAFLSALIAGPRWWRPEVALTYLISFVEFIVLVALGCNLLFPLASERRSHIRWAIRGTVGLGFATIIAILCLIYGHLLHGPRGLQESLPKHNDFPRLKELVAHCDSLNPQRLPLAVVRENADSGVAARLEQLYESLDELLERDSIACFDSSNSAGVKDWQNDITSLSHARSVVLAWDAQSRALAEAGQMTEAVRYDLRSLRMGAAFRKRGAWIHALMGHALEGVALKHLSEIRNQLTCDQIREVTSCMQELSDSREPIEIMLAREAVYDDYIRGWRVRLQSSLEKLLNLKKDYDPNILAPSVLNRHDCRFALLHTELALRCYHETHGRWPEALGELSPDYLPSPPLDPFTQQPLIYHVDGSKFALYSVGEDKIDNGGVFGHPPWSGTRSRARDLDLETWLRDVEYNISDNAPPDEGGALE